MQSPRAAAASQVVMGLSFFSAPKLVSQLVVRCVLGLLSVGALLKVQRATRRQFGANAGRAFVLLTCCQFHWLFYSR